MLESTQEQGKGPLRQRGDLLWFAAVGVSGILALAPSCIVPCGEDVDDACSDWKLGPQRSVMTGTRETPAQVRVDTRVNLQLSNDQVHEGHFIFDARPNAVAHKIVVTPGTVITLEGRRLSRPGKGCGEADVYVTRESADPARFSVESSEPEVSIVIGTVFHDTSECNRSSGDADFDWD